MVSSPQKLGCLLPSITLLEASQNILLSAMELHTLKSSTELCWKVVDAVNRCTELAFSYPESHAQQKEITLGFQRKSVAGIDCCAGATDCVLLWIERPTALDCERVQKEGKLHMASIFNFEYLTAIILALASPNHDLALSAVMAPLGISSKAIIQLSAKELCKSGSDVVA